MRIHKDPRRSGSRRIKPSQSLVCYTFPQCSPCNSPFTSAVSEGYAAVDVEQQ